MSAVLKRGAPPLHQVRAEFVVWPLAAVLVVAGMILGASIPDWVGASPAKDRNIDGWEWLGIALGLLSAILLSAAVWVAMPTLQILDTGQQPRHRRIRHFLVVATGGIALTLLGFLLERLFG
jgi:hypothetical protein